MRLNMIIQSQYDKLKCEIKPFRRAVIEHPIYQSIKSIDDIKRFMQFHIYAVWDFMSLLKELQRRFTNVERIWYPRKNAKLSRLVNEIVVAEESDRLDTGEVISHYDWYIKAMKECGSWTEEFNTFYEYSQISPKLDVPQLAPNPYVEQFLSKTFDAIDLGKDHEVAAYFLIGREGLIPDMFIHIVEQLDHESQQLTLFIAYLKRHIELDGEDHGPLAEEMLMELCQDDAEKWQEAQESAQKALQARKILWDGVVAA